MIIIAHIYPQGNSGGIFRGNKFMLSGGELPQAELLPYVNSIESLQRNAALSRRESMLKF